MSWIYTLLPVAALGAGLVLLRLSLNSYRAGKSYLLPLLLGIGLITGAMILWAAGFLSAALGPAEI